MRVKPYRAPATVLAFLAGLATVVLAAGGSASAGVTYFEVAEPAGRATHHDSYVLPLTRPDDIEHARDLIARGPEEAGASIVFAGIAPGVDGINRNLLAPGQPQWSWHVTDFKGFGDLGIELLDGWPTYVDEHLSQWMQETKGEVGFWSYTIVRELPAAGGPPTAVPLPPALPAAGGTLLGLNAVAYFRRGRREAAGR
jgi:hypothetical protein